MSKLNKDKKKFANNISTFILIVNVAVALFLYLWGPFNSVKESTPQFSLIVMIVNSISILIIYFRNKEKKGRLLKYTNYLPGIVIVVSNFVNGLIYYLNSDVKYLFVFALMTLILLIQNISNGKKANIMK